MRHVRNCQKRRERSLKRLRIDAIDLYLLHWRERTPPLQETVDAFEKTARCRKDKTLGCLKLRRRRHGGTVVARTRSQMCSQIRFCTISRIAKSSSIFCRGANTNKIPIMAYSPVGHSGQLLRNAALKKIAQSHNATPAQIALAWVLRQPDVIAIPKASTDVHVRDNAASLKIKLTKEDLTDLDREFPPPKSKKSLPML